MKNTVFYATFILFFFAKPCFGQYSSLAHEADSLYQKKEYLKSAETFGRAFAANNDKGSSNDRYNAACSWALAGQKDSSFYHLFRLARKAGYSNLGHLSTDTDLTGLHDEARWKELTDLVKKNKDAEEVNLDKPLVTLLDTIHKEDQTGRQQIDGIQKKYGWDSQEMKDHWKIINEKDSLNLIKIVQILDTRGWLGADVVGRQGASTLFLVIQHSDIKVQVKYLPMMREAVKNKKASPSDLALLEDRVGLRRGKKQVYGSQIFTNPKTKEMYVAPLEDPDNVDKRRETMGLGPLKDYISHWNLVWDVEAYKKQLPELEALRKN